MKEFFKEINDDKTLEKHDKLHFKLKQLYCDDKNEEVLELMNLFNTKDIDRGLLRTLLVFIKPVKQEDVRINDMFN